MNIQDGQGFGLAQAIQAAENGFLDVILLTETNIQLQAYSHNCLGCNLNCSAACPYSAGGYQGGFGLVTRERLVGWGIESKRYHGPNVVSCEIVTGLTWIPLVGAYLPPLTLEHLPGLEEALHCFMVPIALGDLNVDLDKARSLRIQRVSDLLAEYILIDLVRHFRQRRRFRDLKNWSQAQQETILQSRCDQILGTDRRRFELVGIQDMRNYSSDHFAIRA